MKSIKYLKKNFTIFRYDFYFDVEIKDKKIYNVKYNKIIISMENNRKLYNFCVRNAIEAFVS